MTDPSNIEAVAAAAATPQPAPDMRKRKPKSEEIREERQLFSYLPENCPVTALGVQGQSIWVLDASSQIINMKTDCKKGDLILLFGGCEYLDERWPQWKQPGKGQSEPVKDGFNQKEVQVDLLSACYAKGIFNPVNRVFGRGAHRSRDDDTQLILHMGNRVMLSSATDWRGAQTDQPISVVKAGRVGESYFPALPTLPAPAKDISTIEEGKQLRALFNRWFFREQDAATLLLLGFSAQMHICGALTWRSHVLATGPTAAGKSYLQSLFRALHGDWTLFAEDASEAAIRQILGDDTLPFLLDEAEGDDNGERQIAILNLMKKASSGGKIIRGSQDHKAQEFTAQSCFMLSCVLHAPLKGEHRNRVAKLDMLQVPEGVAPLSFDVAYWREIGRKMHRRMVQQWPRLAETLATYKREISSHGYSGRWADTFGTLLACADLLLFDDAPRNRTEDAENPTEKAWTRLILPMLAVGKGEALSDTETVMPFLLAKTLQGAHGAAAETVGQWIDRALKPIIDPVTNESHGIDQKARERLKTVGLRLIRFETIDRKRKIKDAWLQDENAYLAVAYPTSSPLCDLFSRSQWEAGKWIQSMQKIDGCISGLKIRFNPGGSENAVAIPLKSFWNSKEGVE
jgi:hypothetical protein